MHKAVTELATELDLGDLQTQGEEWGDLLVRHIALPAGTDFTPRFRGLPDHRCQCAHWGGPVRGAARSVVPAGPLRPGWA